MKRKIVFGPRSVPATSSCSEAIATTSPIGDSSRPAVERIVAGSPPIASAALWSTMLVRDQQQIGGHVLDRRDS